GRHPVVVRACDLFVAGTDEREVLGARDVVGRRAMEIAAGQLLLVELDQLAGRQTLANQPIFFRVGPVTKDDAIRRAKALDLVDPPLDSCILTCHSKLLCNASYTNWHIAKQR